MEKKNDHRIKHSNSNTKNRLETQTTQKRQTMTPNLKERRPG